MLRCLFDCAMPTLLIATLHAGPPLAVKPRSGDMYVIVHREAHPPPKTH